MKMKLFEIINSTCRRVQNKHIVQARDMADAIKKDAPRRKKEKIFKYEVREVKDAPAVKK